LVTSKLPFDLVKCYSEETNNEQDTKRLIEFLRKKVKTIAYTNEMIGTSNSGSNKSNETRVSAFATTPTRPSCCFICKLPHRTIFCRSHDAQTRKDIVSSYPLCYRCLEPNHTIASCSSSYRCPCTGDHSLAICLNGGRPQ